MSLRSLTLVTAGLLLSGFVAACGSGGGGGGDDGPRELFGTIYLEGPDAEGEMTEGQTVPNGGRYGVLSVGNDASGREVRGLLRFDLARIPLGARIVSATLRMERTAVQGDPYAALGTVLLDHVDGGFYPWSLGVFFPQVPNGVDLTVGEVVYTI